MIVGAVEGNTNPVRGACIVNVEFANQRWDVVSTDWKQGTAVITRDDNPGVKVETVGFSVLADVMIHHGETCTHPMYEGLKLRLL